MQEFNLPESPSIVGVRALHRQLTELAASQSDVSISASEVVKIDASSLQTLTAFVIAQKQNGHRVEWKACSAPFLDAAASLGLKEQLGLM